MCVINFRKKRMKEKGKKIVRARQFTYVQDTDHLKVEPKQFQDFLSIEAMIGTPN